MVYFRGCAWLVLKRRENNGTGHETPYQRCFGCLGGMGKDLCQQGKLQKGTLINILTCKIKVFISCNISMTILEEKTMKDL